MLRQKVWVEDSLASNAKDEINKEEIIRVLARAAGDNGFIARLTERGEEALRGYSLTMREKAALLSGDIRWLEAHLGKLNARLRTWPECRLQQEVW
jgi:molybdenum-dependent DNA-binding transcriptional regulator ModE